MNLRVRRKVSVWLLAVLTVFATVMLSACGDPAVKSVSVSKGCTPKTTYYVGETIDVSDVTLTVTYEDDSTEEISFAEGNDAEKKGFTYDLFGVALTTEHTKVTFTYRDVQVSLPISVVKRDTDAPNAADIVCKGVDGTITIQAPKGTEFSLDDGAWQKEKTFANLTNGQEYRVTVRYAETAQKTASAGTEVKVMVKGSQTAIEAASVKCIKRTSHQVQFESIPGAEIRRSDVWVIDYPWPAFYALDPNTEHHFFVRRKETATLWASEETEIVVKTKGAQTGIPKDKVSIARDGRTVTMTVSGVSETLEYIAYRVGGGWSSGWQASNTFELPEIGPKYTFEVRKAGGEELDPSSTVMKQLDTARTVQSPIPAGAFSLGCPSPTSILAQFSKMDASELARIECRLDDSTEYHSLQGNSYLFEGLEPGSTHTVYAHHREDDYYTATEEVSITITVPKYTQARPECTVLDVTSTGITVAAVENAEYFCSITHIGERDPNSLTWVDSNVMEGLTPDTYYFVYVRIKGDATHYPSSFAEKKVRTLASQEIAGTVTAICSYDSITVLVEGADISALQYSLNGGETWQTGNNVFTDLPQSTAYRVSVRLNKTSTADYSPIVTLDAATLKYQAAITTEEFTVVTEPVSATVTFADSFTGEVEYSKDGETWTAAEGKTIRFTGLTPNRSYTFYIRRRGSETLAVSEATSFEVTTPKYTQEKPELTDEPEVTDSTIRVTYVKGAEYSIDGGEYTLLTDSNNANRFEGLLPHSTHVIRVRMAETETHAASEAVVCEITTLKLETKFFGFTASVTYDEVKLSLVSSVEAGRVVLYRQDDGEWTTNNVFSGMQPGESHRYSAKVQEDETHYESNEWTNLIATDQRPVEEKNVALKVQNGKLTVTVHEEGVFQYATKEQASAFGSSNEFTLESGTKCVYVYVRRAPDHDKGVEPSAYISLSLSISGGEKIVYKNYSFSEDPQAEWEENGKYKYFNCTFLQGVQSTKKGVDVTFENCVFYAVKQNGVQACVALTSVQSVILYGGTYYGTASAENGDVVYGILLNLYNTTDANISISNNTFALQAQDGKKAVAIAVATRRGSTDHPTDAWATDATAGTVKDGTIELKENKVADGCDCANILLGVAPQGEDTEANTSTGDFYLVFRGNGSAFLVFENYRFAKGKTVTPEQVAAGDEKTFGKGR